MGPWVLLFSELSFNKGVLRAPTSMLLKELTYAVKEENVFAGVLQNLQLKSRY